MDRPPPLDTVRGGMASTEQDPSELVRRYTPLVRGLARKIRRNLAVDTDADDLFQAGMLGLLEAGRRYQSQGAQFWTFAYARIRGAMFDELRTRDWLPRSVRRFGRAQNAAIQTLGVRLGREPAPHEVADELAMPVETYLKRAADIYYGCIDEYTETAEADHGPSQVAADYPAPFGDPEQATDHALCRAALRQALAELPAREHRVLALRYQDGLTLAATGRIMGLSEGRICQLEGQAVRRIQDNGL